jgi:hypothetical protein
MNIQQTYISGVVDTLIETYQIENGRIEKDKELNYYFKQCGNYMELWFNAKIEISSKWNKDHNYHESRITLSEDDTLEAFISDVLEHLSEIHSKSINYN